MYTLKRSNALREHIIQPTRSERWWGFTHGLSFCKELKAVHLLVKLLLHLAEVREARQHVMELLERSRCSVEQGGNDRCFDEVVGCCGGIDGQESGMLV